MILALCLTLLVVGISGDEFLTSFYTDNGIHSHDFKCQSVEFKDPQKVNCVCVSGLWTLFASCGDYITVSTEDRQCVEIPRKQVFRAVQLSRNRLELSVLNNDGSVEWLEPEETIPEKGTVLITGTEWTLIDKTTGKKICLSFQKEDSYCFYSSIANSKAIQGCTDFDDFMEPLKCEAIKNGKKRSCDVPHKRLHKRDAEDPAAATPPAPDAAAGAAPAAAPAGAAPSPGGSPSTNVSLNEETVVPEDEDFNILNNNGTQNKSEASISILDGLLEFMDVKLDQLLGLDKIKMASMESIAEAESLSRTRRATSFSTLPDDSGLYDNAVLNVTYTNPPYEFLEISKRITQKTCPPFYVHPEFLNLAVATFIRMQQINFKFPETSFKPSGFRRVLNVLRWCEASARRFNFTDADCDGRVDGKYRAFGETLEMTVGSDFLNLKRDPIVETVWKIFFNAHSYCFPFFNRTLDHHRFTTWMIPLFQNQMNDLWVEGETNETSLNGLFGNQVEMQGNLAYCAVSSRLESEYPWDLVRPLGVPEFGSSRNATNNATAPGGAPAPAGGAAAPAAGAAAPPAAEAPPAAARRKREVFGTDLTSVQLPGENSRCADSVNSVLCPEHVYSFRNTEM